MLWKSIILSLPWKHVFFCLSMNSHLNRSHFISPSSSCTFWNHFSWSIFFLMLKRDGKWRLAVIYSSPHIPRRTGGGLKKNKKKRNKKKAIRRYLTWKTTHPSNFTLSGFSFVFFHFHCLHFNIFLALLSITILFTRSFLSTT